MPGWCAQVLRGTNRPPVWKHRGCSRGHVPAAWCRAMRSSGPCGWHQRGGDAMQVRRFPENPIIRPNMDARMGDNINGPSLIRIPDWIEQPLGRYYLYFAHHDGRYIRLAYADDLHGPWQTHEPGVLPLAASH